MEWARSCFSQGRDCHQQAHMERAREWARAGQSWGGAGLGAAGRGRCLARRSSGCVPGGEELSLSVPLCEMTVMAFLLAPAAEGCRGVQARLWEST